MANSRNSPTDLLANGKAFCMMPWVHMHVTTAGQAQACCIGPIPYGNVNQSSLEEIWNGPEIRDFRLKMLQDLPENRCRGCYNREAAGNSSMRLETNAQYAHHLPAVAGTDAAGFAPHARPVYWDIRFSNVCNFRCRTCWHGASSRWFEEARILGNAAGPTARIDSIQDEDAFFQEFENFLPDVEEIYFAGGEPLVMEAHYRLLDLLIAHGKTDLHLRYNSNFSRMDFGKKSIFDYWKAFSNVTLLGSLDAEGARGAYIRKGQNWPDVEQNIRRLRQEAAHVHFVLAPTIGALNAFHFPEFHRNWVERGFVNARDLYVNLLERPDFLSGKIFPPEMKAQLRGVYEGHAAWLETQDAREAAGHIRQIPAFFESADLSRRVPKFQQYMRKLDDLRQESLLAIFPEFIPLLTP